MFWTRAWHLAAIAMLSGCSQLPLDGPARQDIVSGASAVLSNPPLAVVFDYALVDINPIVLYCLSDVEGQSFFKTFGGARPVLRIGVGDVLAVSVFEAAAGGLFLPTGSSNRQGNYVAMPNQTVSSSGSIHVPYAGEIPVAGRTMPEIERDIEAKLVSRALEPQAIVSFIEQNAGNVTVVSDMVSGAAKLKLAGAGETVLDMIAKVGGLKNPGYETFVTVQRKKRSVTMPFSKLVANPQENVYVRPDDLIYIYRQQRKFVALGAVGANVAAGVGLMGLFTFDQDRLSLNEAVAKAGGLQDERADPTQVFLYRFEDRKTLEKMGVDLGAFPADQVVIPTVYRANFRDPSSFLYTQRFTMRDKDTIYVGNADAIEVGKAFAYLRDWTSTAAGVAADANIVAYHGP